MSKKFIGVKRRLFIGVGLGLALSVAFVLTTLVVSGHIPPRALVTGDVRVCGGDPTTCGLQDGALDGMAQITFERLDGPGVFKASTHPTGRFRVTLPAGRYYVYQSWEGPPCCPYRDFFNTGPHTLAITAGQHVELHLTNWFWQA